MQTFSQTNPVKYTRTIVRHQVSDGKGGFYTERRGPYEVRTAYLYQSLATKSDTVKRKKPQGIMLLKSVTDQNHSETETFDSPASYTRELGSRFYLEENQGTVLAFLGSGFGRVALSTPDPSTLLLNRVKEMRGNLAMIMTEYRDTCTLFGSVAETVYQVGIKLARRDFRGLANVAFGVGDDRHKAYWREFSKRRRVADTHLGVVYGVLPLVDDVEKMAYGLYTTARGLKPAYQRISAKDTESGSRTIDSGVFPLNGVDHPVTIVVGEEWSRKDVMYVTFNPSVHRFQQFGLTNPLSALYNAIPYSFIVDTMFNVGSYLGSLDAMIGVDTWFGHTTSKRSWHAVKSCPIFGSATQKGRIYTRSSLAVPTPTLRYEPSDSLKTVLNGLALLTQLRIDRKKDPL